MKTIMIRIAIAIACYLPGALIVSAVSPSERFLAENFTQYAGTHAPGYAVMRAPSGITYYIPQEDVGRAVVFGYKQMGSTTPGYTPQTRKLTLTREGDSVGTAIGKAFGQHLGLTLLAALAVGFITIVYRIVTRTRPSNSDPTTPAQSAPLQNHATAKESSADSSHNSDATNQSSRPSIPIFPLLVIAFGAFGLVFSDSDKVNAAGWLAAGIFALWITMSKRS